MALTHGMNLEEVAKQAQDAQSHSEDVKTQGQTAQTAIQGFIGDSWHGDDATKFGEEWEQITKAYDQIATSLEEASKHVQQQHDDQQHTSES